jgi:hypothetical protein
MVVLVRRKDSSASDRCGDFMNTSHFFVFCEVL